MRFLPSRGTPWSRTRRAAAAAAAAVLGTGLVAVVATQASAAAGCRVTYSADSWGNGFVANLTVTNLGDPISGGWTLEFDYTGNQNITSAWNSVVRSQVGARKTLANAGHNASIGTNASVNPGFQGTYSGTNTAPAAFRLNGVVCTGGITNPSNPPSSSPPSSRPPSSQPPSSQPPSSNPPNPNKVDNPYVGVRGYVNPEWKARAESVPGGNRVSNTPTAVWLDRIAAIEGTDNSQSNGPMGVRDHLDAALAQGAGYIQFVIYNLPGRDCAALASNGELGMDDLPRYKAEYINPIAAIQRDAKYRNLRIINIIEIDSLPNLITNLNDPECQYMKNNGGYVNGVAYAVQQLGAIGNVYNYIDAGHHAWLGWSTNFGPAAQLFADTVRLSGSMNNVHGFISNTANYSATVEPHFNINTSVNGTSVRQSTWLDWNDYVDELSFVQAFRDRLVTLNFPANIGMLIDTSRNGWGGPDRPAGPSTATNVEDFVNQSRIDRRIHAGNWCNQSGAGLGERPRANPAPGVDAYVWIKPPGESDGSSSLIQNPDGKGFDRMCDPTYGGNERNKFNRTGALPNSPISGAWFPEQFAQLMANAYPRL